MLDKAPMSWNDILNKAQQTSREEREVPTFGPPAGSFTSVTAEGEVPTGRFVSADLFPPIRLVFPGEIPVRVLKVTPTTGEQAMQGYAKVCSPEMESNGDPIKRQ
jgi:hypothetical protein